MSPSVESKTSYLKEGSVNIVFATIKAIYSYVNSFVHIRLIRGARLLAVGVGLWMMGVSVWGQCIDATVTSTNVSCNGSSDGTIIITGITGGSAPYDFSLDGSSTWSASL